MAVYQRVVITGIGAVTPLGNDAESITEALQDMRSGIVFSPEYAEAGFSSQVWAPVDDAPLRTELGRRRLRFAGKGKTLVLGLAAFDRAVADAGLGREELAGRSDVFLYAAQGGPSTQDQCQAWDTLKETGSPRKIGPFAVVPTMNSGLAALIAVDYRLHGLSWGVSSACASSAHAIGEAAVAIATGRCSMAFAGGAEDAHVSKAMGFDAMRALSSKYNDTPQEASRPFDKDRDGFVIGEGAGFVVLEALEHAQARGARIIAEVLGYGASSDGHHMTEPSGLGAEACMRQALVSLGGLLLRDESLEVDYLNAHGTSTPKGDIAELKAVHAVFGNERFPAVSSTKSLTGHCLGAAGVTEAIYSLLMMQAGFACGTANLHAFDSDVPAVAFTSLLKGTSPIEPKVVMSNSFGFGGTNASLVFGRWE